MRRRAKALLAATAAIGLALTAAAQDGPESLLPPGFGQPSPPPAPAASAAPKPAPLLPPAAPAGQSTADTPPAPLPPPVAGADEAVTETDGTLPPDDLGLAAIEPEEMPEAARRSLALVGTDPVYGQDAFGDGDGRYVVTLMRRLQTPIASRWAEIALRRLLLGATPAPAGEDPADWVADRAALLLRLGEADAARMLVQGVDVIDFTPRLRQVAIRTALATADPAGLCPLPDGNEQVGRAAAWPLIRAMCATLAGDAATANASIGRAPPGDPIDHALAEKLVAAGGGGRRRVAIDWTAVDTLTDWRFGVAVALGVVMPQPLLDAAPPFFQGWLAQAPMLTASDRIASARVAAALGPVSNADLVDLYSRAADEAGDLDPDSAAGHLRAAYRGEDDDARMAGLHALWDAAANGTGGERDRYAAAVLTARAATAVSPVGGLADEAAALVGAMLAGGFDRQAMRWAGIAEAADDRTGDRAWAMLAVGGERPPAATQARLRAIAKRAGSDGAPRVAMLAAGLAGLGRLAPADAAAFAGGAIDTPTPYARALARAVDARAPGTVILLAAVGLQSERWGGVAPADLYRAVAALRAAGLDGEARMIAAEAVARL